MSDEYRHLLALMNERDKRYEQRFQGQERAIDRAKDSTERRLDLLNELREGVATSAELSALEKVVDDLRDRFNHREGKGSGFNAAWGIALGAIGLAATILTIIGMR